MSNRIEDWFGGPDDDRTQLYQWLYLLAGEDFSRHAGPDECLDPDCFSDDELAFWWVEMRPGLMKLAATAGFQPWGWYRYELRCSEAFALTGDDDRSHTFICTHLANLLCDE